MLRPIDKQVQTTYLTLRLTAAAIAITFPLLLWVGGKMACFPLRYCMSDYYWAAPGQHCPCNEIEGVCQKKEVKLVDPDQRRLSAEFLGIYAFAGYWLVKTYEIRIIQKQREKRKQEMIVSSNFDESLLTPPVY